MKSPLAALEIRRGGDVDGAIVKRLKSGVALGAKKSHLCEVVDGGELVVELVVVWCCALLHFLSNGLLRGFSSSGWVRGWRWPG